MICDIISYLHIRIIGLLLSVSLLLCFTTWTESHKECQKSQETELMSSCLEDIVDKTEYICSIFTIY